MKKTWLFLTVVLAFGMTMIGCGGGGEGGGEHEPFTFSYEGDISLARNTWDTTKANNQAVLEGTIANSIENGKSYEIHITGTLSHDAYIQAVLVDNAGSNWNVLSDYKAEDSEIPVDGDEGKFVPKIFQAGTIDTTIVVTATAAGGSTAAGNKVVVQALKPDSTDATDDRSIAQTVIITGAKVTVAEKEGDDTDDDDDDVTSNIPEDAVKIWDAADGSIGDWSGGDGIATLTDGVLRLEQSGVYSTLTLTIDPALNVSGKIFAVLMKANGGTDGGALKFTLASDNTPGEGGDGETGGAASEYSVSENNTALLPNDGDAFKEYSVELSSFWHASWYYTTAADFTAIEALRIELQTVDYPIEIKAIYVK
ncbi:MAG: hypothetical protein LBG43_05180 [Treponema sp.]|jgi:hypothetical protein|nr:hypothetical protein [Treponema sp.]